MTGAKRRGRLGKVRCDRLSPPWKKCGLAERLLPLRDRSTSPLFSAISISLTVAHHLIMPAKTIKVNHLGGIQAGYQMPKEYDKSKPTLVLINSFTTDSELYRAQYEDKRLTDAMNLLAIEPLGEPSARISH